MSGGADAQDRSAQDRCVQDRRARLTAAVDAADRRLDVGLATELLREHLRSHPEDHAMAARLGFILRREGAFAAAWQIHARLAQAAPATEGMGTAAIDSAAALAIHEHDWPRLQQTWGEAMPKDRGITVRVGEAPDLPSVLVRVSVDPGGIAYAFGRRQGGGCPSARADIVAMRMLRLTVFWLTMREILGRPFVVLLDPTDGDAALPPLPRLAASGNAASAFLIPDFDYVATRGYREMLPALGTVAWADRIDAAIWRGSPTGTPPPGGNWRDLPRVRLCRLAAESGGRIDAGLHQLTDIARFGPDRRDGLDARDGLARWLKGSVPTLRHDRWRRQIDIDGHTNGWSGLFQRLATGSPVLKVASAGGWRQWYYRRLLPWGNFVPVAADLSDLLDKADWLARHDDEARAIGTAGRALAQSLDWRSVMREAASTVDAAARALRAAGG